MNGVDISNISIMNNPTKKIQIFTHTFWKKDPRVLKHKKFFENLGYQVEIAGLERSICFFRKFIYFILMLLRFHYSALIFKYRTVVDNVPDNFEPDYVFINDWITLPLAFKYYKNKDTKIIYDSHEYPKDGYINSIRMKLTVLPAAEIIERNYITKTDFVITVCDSIAKRFNTEYGVNPLVIRNCPEIIDIPENPDATIIPIKLYHHGMYNKSRKLENFIEAVLHFPEKYIFYIRLSGNYSKLYKKYKNAQNIIFLEPVKPEHLTRSAVNFDIGVSYIYPSNYNNYVSLSNKFFEYIMAGLPGLIGPSPEMAKIILKHDIGFISRAFSTSSLVDLLKEISSGLVEQKKSKVRKVRLNYSYAKEWSKLSDFIK
ncbi:MAG: hypothetical protein ACP5FK_10470 [bacterium]